MKVGRGICYFFAEIFRSFFLKHFGHLFHSLLKLCTTVFFTLYFQTFWLKWLNFFRPFQIRFDPWPQKKQRGTKRCAAILVYAEVLRHKLSAVHEASASTMTCGCWYSFRDKRTGLIELQRNAVRRDIRNRWTHDLKHYVPLCESLTADDISTACCEKRTTRPSRLPSLHC